MDQSNPICRVALVNLDESAAAILSNAFRQFGIQTTSFTTNSYEGLGQQKFDGCAVRLSAGCESILTGLRNSPRDRNVFIYGILDPIMAERFSTPLENELKILRESGARVELIMPDGESLEAFGMNLMDRSRRPAAAKAGLSQGRIDAARLRSFWR